jgi:hypothetical protein
MLFASFEVSLSIAKTKKLILPAAKAIKSRILEDTAANNNNLISLSNTTVQQTGDLTDNVMQCYAMHVQALNTWPASSRSNQKPSGDVITAS